MTSAQPDDPVALRTRWPIGRALAATTGLVLGMAGLVSLFLVPMRQQAEVTVGSEPFVGLLRQFAVFVVASPLVPAYVALVLAGAVTAAAFPRWPMLGHAAVSLAGLVVGFCSIGLGQREPFGLCVLYGLVYAFWAAAGLVPLAWAVDHLWRRGRLGWWLPLWLLVMEAVTLLGCLWLIAWTDR